MAGPVRAGLTVSQVLSLLVSLAVAGAHLALAAAARPGRQAPDMGRWQFPARWQRAEGRRDGTMREGEAGGRPGRGARRGAESREFRRGATQGTGRVT